MPDDQLEPVLEIVTTLARKAAAGGYIFRGESICHDLVSSSLYRVYSGLGVSGFDIEVVQQEMLDRAMEYLSGGESREILTQLQHYGGKTNLIDFTTDYLVSLFFACDGGPGKDGRVVFLPKSGEADSYTAWQPHSLVQRIMAQKSIFVEPAQGFVEVGVGNQVIIPSGVKQSLLNYLDVCHDISARTIYNDLHGFIRQQNAEYEAITSGNSHLGDEDYQGAIESFSQALVLNPQLAVAYNGRGVAYDRLVDLDLANQDFAQAIDLNPQHALAYNNRGLIYWRKGERDLAVQDFTSAIDQDPDYAEAYCNRGEAGLHLGEWEKAKADLTAAKDMGFDLVASFRNDYESVAAFEQQHGLEVPPDIAEMLGG